MNPLKQPWLAVVELVRQVGQVPHNIKQAGRERQQRLVLEKLEAERRDRIINPWKYLGK